MPKAISPPGFIVEEVRRRNNVKSIGDVLVDLLKSFRLLEDCPWLPSDGTERWGLLKKLLIGSTTGERNLFLESLGLRELSFAMLTMVRDNKRSVTRRRCVSHSLWGFLTPDSDLDVCLHNQLLMITFIFVLGIDLVPWDNRHRVSWSIASVYMPRNSHYY